MDEFSPEAIQIAFLANAYIELFIELHGNYAGWIRAVGRPLTNLFLSDFEIEELLEGGTWSSRGGRARALFLWAGVDVPTWKNEVIVTKQRNTIRRDTFNAEVLGWHALALQYVYEHPEQW